MIFSIFFKIVLSFNNTSRPAFRQANRAPCKACPGSPCLDCTRSGFSKKSYNTLVLILIKISNVLVINASIIDQPGQIRLERFGFLSRYFRKDELLMFDKLNCLKIRVFAQFNLYRRKIKMQS
jgi:hypothetical protein